MTSRVGFHPLASAEVIDAQLWYEDQVVGLGDRFLTPVRAAVERAVARPAADSPTRTSNDGQVIERRVALAKFPYVIVYTHDSNGIEVLAVHHARRQPLYWADRITPA